MIFHENRLLVDNSPEISCLIFFQKLRKLSQNLSSAVVKRDGALRVNSHVTAGTNPCTVCTKKKFKLYIMFDN